MAFAVAVGAAKIGHCFAFFRDLAGYAAFFGFSSGFGEDFQDCRVGVLQEVVDVPENLLFLSEVTFDAFLHCDLR